MNTLGEYEHVKVHEWGMMAALWFSEELVDIVASIKRSLYTVFAPLDASIFQSQALETLEPQIKPPHCRNASMVADFWHGA